MCKRSEFHAQLKRVNLKVSNYVQTGMCTIPLSFAALCTRTPCFINISPKAVDQSDELRGRVSTANLSLEQSHREKELQQVYLLQRNVVSTAID